MNATGEQPERPACPAGRRALSAWGRLLRLPNLLTVPGDPIAGFLLASAAGATAAGGAGWRIGLAVFASMCLYAMGLVQNDVAHARRDAIERPERPIPSGQISRGKAMAAAGCLSAAAVLAAALLTIQTGDNTMFWLVWTLFGLITLYNYVTSRLPVIRPINMGLCRGASLLLGAAAAGGAEAVTYPPVLIAAGVLTLYIAGVTAIATRETVAHRVGLVRWLPPAALLAGVFIWARFGETIFLRAPLSIDEAVTWAQAMVVAGHLVPVGALLMAMRLNGVRKPQRVGQTVGMFVRWVIVVQAAMAAVAGGAGLWVAVGLLAAWLAAGLLARRVPSS